MYVSFLTFQDDKEKGGLSLLFRILVIKIQDVPVQEKDNRPGG
jgi:hypothetical protein